MSILYGQGPVNQSFDTPTIVQQRDPGNGDLYDVGQKWINTASNEIFFLTSFANGLPVWTGSVGGGAGIFSDLTVNPGPTAITGEFRVLGNVDEAAVIRLQANGGATETIVIESVQGTGADSIQINSQAGGMELTTNAASGDIKISADLGSIEMSTAGAVGNIVISSDGGGTVTVGSTGNTGTNDLLLNVNGGTSSKLLINNELSTDVAAIKMLSPVGGIEITTQDTLKNVVIDSELGFVVAGASATSLGVDILNITPTVSRTTSINTNVVDTAVTDQIDIGTGGVSTDAGAEKIINIGTGSNLLGTQEVNISTGTAASGSKAVNIGNADSLTQLNALGVIQMNASGSGTTVIGNTISGGAATIDSTGVISIESTAASATAIHLNASGVAGGITVAAGNNGIAESSTGAISITSSDGLSNAITLDATGAGGGISIAPTNTTVAVGIANVIPTVARTTSINAGAVGSAVADTLNLGTGATNFAGASKVVNIATSNNTNGTTAVNIATGTVASGTETVAIATGTGGGTKTVQIGNVDALTTISEFGTVNINTSTSTGATTIGNADSGGAIALTTNTSVSIDSKTASHMTITGAADLTLSSSAGSIVMTGGEAAVDAVQINASNAAGGVDINVGTGGITIDTTGAMSFDSAAASNMTVTGAFDLTVNSVGGSVNVSGTEAAADAIALSAANGGMTLATAAASNVVLTGGNFQAASATKGMILGSGTKVIDGAGSPNASVTATKGSLYLSTNGSGVADRLYINTDGATAWTAITTVS